MKMYYFIYETTNLINNKTYIGQHSTTNLNDGYLGSGSVFRRALKKYGKENFKREILLFAKDAVSLNFLESGLVNIDFINDNSNYNCRVGGNKGSCSAETRIKLSLAAKRNAKKTGIFFKKFNKGRKLSKEHRSKISKGQIGRIQSSDTRKKVSDALLKLKLKRNPETVKRVNELNKGRKLTEEVKLKMSAAKLLWWKNKKSGDDGIR